MLPHASARPATRPRPHTPGVSTPDRPRASALPTTLLATLVAVVAGVAPVLLGAVPAAAHSALVSSDPADGATTATAPAQVTLTFNEAAVALGTVVEVQAPDGRVVSTGDPVLAGTDVVQALAGELPAGDYSVLWRVTSADGHPIDGRLTFTAQGPTTVGAAPGTAATAGPAATPTPTEPAASGTTPTAPTASTALTHEDHAAEASATNTLLVGTVAVLAALGVVVAVLIRRRPHGHHGGSGGSGAAPSGRTPEDAGPDGSRDA
ncbi:copper resistance CopC family protein [Cellulomonas sp. NS3]|uniref:copper resistance CopC family protein n=1 Tax=Cellulomonas sp. NS3 TaxID=2973977 RepID=UPI002161F400|nr:copper resistance CopC family protein [Cellulomonas sp. NS3]